MSAAMPMSAIPMSTAVPMSTAMPMSATFSVCVSTFVGPTMTTTMTTMGAHMAAIVVARSTELRDGVEAATMATTRLVPVGVPMAMTMTTIITLLIPTMPAARGTSMGVAMVVQIDDVRIEPPQVLHLHDALLDAVVLKEFMRCSQELVLRVWDCDAEPHRPCVLTCRDRPYMQVLHPILCHSHQILKLILKLLRLDVAGRL